MTPIFPCAAAAAVLLCATTAATAGVVFGPVRAGPGECVRLISRAVIDGGTIETDKHGRTSQGTVEILRERDLSWTFRDPAEDGTLRGRVNVAKIAAFSKVVIDGKEDRTIPCQISPDHLRHRVHPIGVAPRMAKSGTGAPAGTGETRIATKGTKTQKIWGSEREICAFCAFCGQFRHARSECCASP